MFIAGLGVGPTFSVPTIVIQNAVPFRQLGVATSNLTFFRQIGGTIALAFVGTIFASTFQEQLPTQFLAAGVPPSVLQDFGAAAAAGKIDANVLTGVGDVGARITAIVASAGPVIDQVLDGIHAAFSLATAQTFWLGVVGAIVALVAAVAIKEIPLRTSNEQPVYGEAPAGASAATASAAAASTSAASASKPAPSTD